MPIRFCSVMPSMYQRSGISRFIVSEQAGAEIGADEHDTLVALGQLVDHVETGLRAWLHSRAA